MTRVPWLLWLAVVAGVITVWASYVPMPARGRLDTFVPFTQLVAIRPLLASGLAVIAVVGVVYSLRRRRTWVAPLALLLVAAVAACVQVAPRTISNTARVSRATPAITVLAANTLRSSVRPGVIVDLVRRTRADIVSLPETNAARAEAFARALSADRDERWDAHSDNDFEPGARGAEPTSLLARAALGAKRLAGPVTAPRALGQVRVRLTRVGSASDRPMFVAVHASPPAPVRSQADWRRDIRALAALCDAGWILAGDFNATIDHSPMRSLKRAGCADAAATTGHGLNVTWIGGPYGLFRLTLDHVLTSDRWRATASGVLDVEGSDHRALWARISRR